MLVLLWWSFWRNLQYLRFKDIDSNKLVSYLCKQVWYGRPVSCKQEQRNKAINLLGWPLQLFMSHVLYPGFDWSIWLFCFTSLWCKRDVCYWSEHKNISTWYNFLNSGINHTKLELWWLGCYAFNQKERVKILSSLLRNLAWNSCFVQIKWSLLDAVSFYSAGLFVSAQNGAVASCLRSSESWYFSAPFWIHKNIIASIWCGTW